MSEEDCRIFVRLWAEAVIRQVQRVGPLREKDAAQLAKYARNEESAPTADELQRMFRELWSEEQMLIWTAYQLERWKFRLMVESGEEPDTDEELRIVRNALEHLDAADFEGVYAVPGQNSYSLKKLPGGRLPLVVGGDLPYGLTVDQLGYRALAILRLIAQEEEQALLEQQVSTLTHDD